MERIKEEYGNQKNKWAAMQKPAGKKELINETEEIMKSLIDAEGK